MSEDKIFLQKAANFGRTAVLMVGMLVLMGSGRPAGAMRSVLTAKLLTAGRGRRVIREPLVRSVHSYAFAVLRQAAARAGDPPPRLVTGAEQDGIIGDQRGRFHGLPPLEPCGAGWGREAAGASAGAVTAASERFEEPLQIALVFGLG